MATKKTNTPFLHLDPDTIWISGIDDNETDAVTHDETRGANGTRQVTESMILNVKKFGILQPIRVRKDGQYYVAVDGRGRILAAREANRRLQDEGNPLIKIPAVLELGNDDHVLGVMISANEHRQDDTPMGRARKLQKLLARGYSDEECAVIFGVELQTIGTWKPLLDLDDSVQKAIDDGKLSAFAATPLAALPRKEQKAQLAELVQKVEAGERVTARETRERAASATGREISTAPSKRQINRLLGLGLSVLQEGGLSEDFIKGVRWMAGELATKSVGGLSALLAQADEAGKKKREKKAKAVANPKHKGKKAPPRAGKVVPA